MKKILSVLLAAVMLLSLVGCAQQAAPQQPASEPTANETAAEGEAAKTEESAASAEPVTITYMRHAEGADVELELVEEFMKENPDIKVVVDSVPANDTYNKLVLSHNAGNPPDVFHTFWTVDAAVNGMIEPLTNYITNEEFDKRFTSAARVYGEYNGTLYAIPWRAGADVFFVNTSMLEAAGLELPKEGWTWDDLKTYAKALRNVDKGEYGFAICGSSSDAGTEWQFWPFLLQNGGKIIENGKAVFNSPAGVEALEFICSLIKEDLIPAGVASMDLNQMTDMQVANKLAMWHDGPWMLGSLQLANPDANIVAVPMTKNVMGGNICGGTAIAISSISPNKEAAWKFLNFMTSDEALLRWCSETNNVPPNYYALENEFYQADNMKVVAGAALGENVIPANSYPESTTLNSIMRNYLQAAYLGQMSAQEALDAAAEEWNAVLANYNG